MTERRTRERPLGLDMDPDEALERFIGVDPDQLPEGVKLGKKRGPPKQPPVVKRMSSRPKGKT